MAGAEETAALAAAIAERVRDPAPPLFRAARDGNLRRVRELLAERGTDANAPDPKGWTPLMIAAQRGSATVLQPLLDARCDVDATSTETRWTALCVAAQQGHSGCVQLLLAARASVDHTTTNGWTALMWAARNKHGRCVRSLLAAGAATDVEAGPVQALRVPGGASPLMLAAQGGSADCVAALLEAGSDVSHRSREEGLDALTMAVRWGRADCVPLLLAARGSGAQAPSVDKEGYTPLMWAARNRRDSIAEALLAAGAGDVNAVNHNGESALWLAAWRGRERCVSALLEAGAEVDRMASASGQRPLDVAVLFGHGGCVRRLVAARACVEAPDGPRDRVSPLCAAAILPGGLEVVRCLLAAGANPLTTRLVPAHLLPGERVASAREWALSLGGAGAVVDELRVAEARQRARACAVYYATTVLPAVRAVAAGAPLPRTDPPDLLAWRVVDLALSAMHGRSAATTHAQMSAAGGDADAMVAAAGEAELAAIAAEAAAADAADAEAAAATAGLSDG